MLNISIGVSDSFKLEGKKGSDLGLSDSPFEGSNDGKLEGLVIGFGYTLKVVEVTKDVTTPGYIGRIVCGCTEVIDLGIYYG